MYTVLSQSIVLAAANKCSKCGSAHDRIPIGAKVDSAGYWWTCHAKGCGGDCFVHARRVASMFEDSPLLRTAAR